MAIIDTIRVKVDRAKHHICDLDRERLSFLNPTPYVVTPEYYSEHDTTVFYLDTFPQIPDPIALISGDIAHNLRSALDHLAHQLVVRAGKTPTTRTGFPIFESDGKYNSYSGGKISLMRQEAQDAIAALKPYQGGNDALWGLHELDRIDKHRVLITAIFAVNKIDFTITVDYINKQFAPLGLRFTPDDGVFSMAAPLPTDMLVREVSKAGDVLMFFGGNHEKDKNIQFTFDIAFGEPEVFKGKPVLVTLQSLADLVDDIITDFAPFLK